VSTYHYALDALGDPTRREIFERLREGPKAVGELAGTLPVSRPAVSQHLRILEDAGLVRHTRDGTRHLYRVDPAAVDQLRAYFERFWSDALEQVRSAVEDDGKRGAR
jgi:DNA-binding transcriptional ArsR family regulator